VSRAGATTTYPDTPLSRLLPQALLRCRRAHQSQAAQPLPRRTAVLMASCFKSKGELGKGHRGYTAAASWPLTHRPFRSAQCARIQPKCTAVCRLLANEQNSRGDNLHKSHPEVRKAWHQRHC